MSDGREGRSGVREALGTASRVYLHLGPAQAVVRSEVDALLVRTGVLLSGSDYAVLATIAGEAGGVSIGTLADHMVIPRTSARRVVDRLREAGLVVSEPGSEDRRYRRWSVTEEGRRMVADVDGPPQDGSFAAAVARLASAEIEALYDDLTTVLAGLVPGHQAEVRSRGALRAVDVGTSGALFELWMTLTRVWRMVRDEQSRFLLGRTDGALESGAYQTLYYVAENPSTSSNGIASFLHVDQNTATRIVDRLEAIGLVARTRNPADRRQVVIAATSEGRDLLAAVPPIDPDGPFVSLVRGLPGGGTRLAEVLESLVAGLIDEPIIDLSGLDTLLDGLAQRAAENLPARVDRDAFRTAMSRFLTGVAVITIGRGGRYRGITVNSLTSVSLDPPTLLICFDRRSPALERVRQHQAFAANILSARQQHLAERFGRRESADNPHSLDEGMYTVVDGVPTLRGSLATVVCDVEGTYEAGSHTIVLATARHLDVPATQEAAALGFWKSRYLHLEDGTVTKDEVG